jgi:uncharacterized membrane protein YdjX (TVP38/TMEM64 family)
MSAPPEAGSPDGVGETPSPKKRVPRPLLVAVLIVIAFVGGHALRVWHGVSLHPESLHGWIASGGWLAPATFVVLVTCRQFLLLPSMLLLSVGGVFFGTALGTLLGSVGVLLSGALTFALARGMSGENLRKKLAARFPSLDKRIDTAGPMLVWLATAYPAGPMTGAFWASGFSSMRWLPFLAAVAGGAVVRAFAYSFFGATLLEFGSSQFWVAAVLLTAAIVVPLAHPGLRRWIFAS